MCRGVLPTLLVVLVSCTLINITAVGCTSIESLCVSSLHLLVNPLPKTPLFQNFEKYLGRMRSLEFFFLPEISTIAKTDSQGSQAVTSVVLSLQLLEFTCLVEKANKKA